MLFAFLVEALINGSVRPGFFAVAMLFVVTPLTNIPRSVCVRVGALSVGFVVAPGPLVNVPVGVVQGALPIGLVFLPLAFIFGSIGPLLRAKAVSCASFPLSFVNCIRFECDWPLLHPFVRRIFAGVFLVLLWLGLQ